jgi:hypothetical protein
MAVELSSAGVSVQYAVEATAGVRPTTGYTKIPGIKSTPDLNPENSALDVTDLGDTEYKRYIAGLKDVGGTIAFTANNTEEFHTTWASIVAAYETAIETSLGMWFAIIIPGLTKAFFMKVEPKELGLNAIEVDSVLEIDAYVAPQQIVGWETKPV